tara:strand:+ start:5024 stop:5182 length:159 start_codon:yes stop_codon:yes gene_type:complete
MQNKLTAKIEKMQKDIIQMKLSKRSFKRIRQMILDMDKLINEKQQNNGYKSN